MKQLSLKELLSPTVALAKEAGQAILQVYRGPGEIKVQWKADLSPVTQADFVAHQIITKGLQSLTPDIPVLSEEGESIPSQQRRSWQQFWLVDPLDGTKEFIHATDEFTVNIALIQDHKPVLGVVYLPVFDSCYFACQGQGAYKQVGTETPIPIKTRQANPKSLEIVVSRRHGTEGLHQFLEKLGAYTILQKGSSLKSCLVAEGTADIYPGFVSTSEWDTAAAQCVVEESGGRVIDMQFSPLRYNMKTNLLNPEFLVIGDPDYNWSQYL